MNVIRRNLQTISRQAGQSIYQTMLIIACVALAVAIFFPVFEFVQYYRGPSAADAAATTPATRKPAASKPKPAADTDATSEEPKAEGAESSGKPAEAAEEAGQDTE